MEKSRKSLVAKIALALLSILVALGGYYLVKVINHQKTELEEASDRLEEQEQLSAYYKDELEIAVTNRELLFNETKDLREEYGELVIHTEQLTSKNAELGEKVKSLENANRNLRAEVETLKK